MSLKEIRENGKMNYIQRIEELELIKEIAHTITHRMTLWQFLIKGKEMRKQYDSACQEISEINSLLEKAGCFPG